jgi:N-acetylglucosaminyldiphosphoundecaprenol N-acetyl-beta-D-mannosaminyltransferase
LSAQVDVLGVGVSAINRAGALEELKNFVASGRREYVCVTGVHGIIESQRDAYLKRIHNSAGIVTPDGMPMVWCGRYAGAKSMDRVAGRDLMVDVMEASLQGGWRHFFYGAAPGVAEELSRRMQDLYPGIEVVGSYSPPFRELEPSEVDDVAKLINTASPDFVWVGLSTPKQEYWMSTFRGLLDAPVLIGVGAAFDMHTGRIPEAPRWMQRSGLEWLFRLLAEPRRLWRRYLTIIPRFIIQIAWHRPRMIELSRGNLGRGWADTK